MKRGLFLVLPLMLMIVAGNAESGGISQYFDRTGKLTGVGKKATNLRPRHAADHSVPEGLALRKDVQYEFYPVFGKTFAEIVRSAEENGPLNKKISARQTSAYDWRIGWTYRFSFTAEEDEETGAVHCDIVIHDVNPAYSVSIILPALTDDSSLNPVEKELWKNYLMSLLEREHAHVRIIKDDTQDIILKRLGEVTYLLLSPEEAADMENAVERFVRAETEKTGRDIVVMIRQKLSAFDADPAP
jgi:predicted secreted Zn-dependent protease